MKTKLFIYIVITFGLIFTSCSDFLEEDNKTGKTEELVYSTTDDLENLAASAYSYLHGWYGKEGGVGYSEAGTDLYYEASDCKMEVMTQYVNLGPDVMNGNDNNAILDQYWEMFYAAVNLVNTGIYYIELNEPGLTEDRVTRLLSELKFLRAFYYWHMVETWGPVTLNTEPIRTVNLYPERNTVEEIYAQMFEDVQFAIDNLDATEAPNSRVNYWGAKAFKARLALYYASEYDYTDYYATALTEAKDIINNTGVHGKSLNPDYEQLWEMDDDNQTTTVNQEWLWGIDYYDDLGESSSYNALPPRLTGEDWSPLIVRRQLSDGTGAGVTLHLLWTPRWHALGGSGGELFDLLARVSGDATGEYTWYTAADSTGTTSFDVGYWYVKYSMGYCRWAPSLYALNLFDETIDQRYDATFRTVWEKHPDVIPAPNSNYPDCQDTALFWSKHELTEEQLAWASTRYLAVDITTTFTDDGNGNIIAPNTGGDAELQGGNFFPMVRKYENTESTIEAMSNFQDYYSGRDIPIFRMGEIYLIAAEAALQSDASQAYSYLETLADNRTKDITGAELLQAYGINSASDITIDKILDERARELLGEFQRWFDLKRTEKLEQQIVNHPDNSFDASKHYLRPIPETQVNTVLNSEIWQNPNY